jgi:hypothetical protein
MNRVNFVQLAVEMQLFLFEPNQLYILQQHNSYFVPDLASYVFVDEIRDDVVSFTSFKNDSFNDS